MSQKKKDGPERIILNVPLKDLYLAGRAARDSINRNRFGNDGYALVQYSEQAFIVKRNKTSYSVWLNGG